MPTLTVKSHPRHLAEVRQFVRAIAIEAGLKEEPAYNLVLAVDEACANIIRHAYLNDHSQDIIVNAEVRPDAIEFRLRDFGRQVDPATIKSRDLDKVRPGGLGCHLMAQVFEKVEYNSNLPQGTELRLLKKL
jgi:anti-sigma regulatory factor (Ser/Thr protein kinase)